MFFNDDYSSVASNNDVDNINPPRIPNINNGPSPVSEIEMNDYATPTGTDDHNNNYNNNDNDVTNTENNIKQQQQQQQRQQQEEEQLGNNNISGCTPRTTNNHTNISTTLDSAIKQQKPQQQQHQPHDDNKSTLKTTTTPYLPALHRALLSPSPPPLSLLRTHLLARPSAASIKDSRGRLPLHLLSSNDNLFRTTSDKSDLKEFILELFRLHPIAAITADDVGRIPFSYALVEWVESECGNCYREKVVGEEGDGGGGVLMADVMEELWHGGRHPDDDTGARHHQSHNTISMRNNNNVEHHHHLDNNTTNDNSAISSMINSFFKPRPTTSSSVSHHHQYPDAMSIGPSIAPSTVPSIGAPSSVCTNSVWSYRYERRADVRQSLQNNKKRKSKVNARTTNGVTNEESGFSFDGAAARAIIAAARDIDEETASCAMSISPRDATSSVAKSQNKTGNHSLVSSAYPSVMQNWTRDDGCDKESAFVPEESQQQQQQQGAHDDNKSKLSLLPPPSCVAPTKHDDNNNCDGTVIGANDSFTFPRRRVSLSAYTLYNLEVLNLIHETLLSMPSSSSSSCSSNYLLDSDDDDDDSPQWLAKVLISALSSIPNLAKTLHFCPHSSSLQQQQQLPLVSYILSSPYAIGNWIVYMMESPQLERFGVSYLEKFTSNHHQEFERIEYLDYILPSLLALQDESLVDRASRTMVWEYIADMNLKGEMLPIVATDFVFLVLLLVSFHAYTLHFLMETFTSSSSSSSSSSSQNNFTAAIIWFNLGAIAALYLSLRKIHAIVTIFKITSVRWNLLRRYLGGFWNMVEFLAVGGAGGMLIWMHINVGRGYYELPQVEVLMAVTGLLWVNLLGWWRLVNVDVGFYMNVLIKVLKDVQFFIIIIAIIFLFFSQIFQILQLPTCPTSSSSPSFPDCTNPYIHTYSTLLLSFDYADYISTPGTITLFLILTLTSVTILFPTLISIVNHTYSHALHTSSSSSSSSSKPPETYQTARLIYLTHTKTLYILLTSSWTLMQYCASLLFFATVGVLLLLSMEEKRIGMMNYYGYIIFMGGLGVVLFFLVVSVMAFESHVTFYDKNEGRQQRGLLNCCGIARRRRMAIVGFLCKPLRWVVKSALLRSYPTSKTQRNNAPTMQHVEDSLSNSSTSSTSSQTSIHSLMKQQMKQQREDMERHSQNLVRDLRMDLLREMSCSHEKMEDMMMHLQSLIVQMQPDVTTTMADDNDESRRIRGTTNDESVVSMASGKNVPTTLGGIGDGRSRVVMPMASQDAARGVEGRRQKQETTEACRTKAINDSHNTSYVNMTNNDDDDEDGYDAYHKDVIKVLETKKEDMMEF